MLSNPYKTASKLFKKGERLIIEHRGERLAVLISGAILGIFLFWLYAVALHLKLDYFDSYSVLLNARAIAWFRPEEYFWNRFPLLPIVLSPFFKLEFYYIYPQQ